MKNEEPRILRELAEALQTSENDPHLITFDQLLEAARPSPPSAGEVSVWLEKALAQQRLEEAKSTVGPAVVLLLSLSTLLVSASKMPLFWTQPSGIGFAIALVAGALALQKPRWSIVLSLLSAIGLTALEPTQGPIFSAFKCLSFEVVSAMAPLSIGWFLIQRGKNIGSRELAAAGAAGALAGETVLQFLCGSHAFESHRWTSHVGGVLVSMALGVVLAKLRLPLFRLPANE